METKLNLKQLVAGRPRWSRAAAIVIVTELRASGLKAWDFARREDLDLGRLVAWNRKLPAKTSDGAATAPAITFGFQEVRLPSDQVALDAGFEVLVGGQHVLRVKRHVDVAVLVRVVQALGALEC